MALLRIIRKSRYPDLFRAYQIILDGKSVDTIRGGFGWEAVGRSYWEPLVRFRRIPRTRPKRTYDHRRERLGPGPQSQPSLARGRSRLWVTGGKAPSEYMFSELPQLADIVRSAFDHLENPLVLRITAFWVRAIPG